jgi:hypothetical protein
MRPKDTAGGNLRLKPGRGEARDEETVHRSAKTRRQKTVSIAAVAEGQ